MALRPLTRTRAGSADEFDCVLAEPQVPGRWSVEQSSRPESQVLATLGPRISTAVQCRQMCCAVGRQVAPSSGGQPAFGGSETDVDGVADVCRSAASVQADPLHYY